MVVLSESYIQHLEHKAIAEALTIHIQPKTFKRYVDHSHARFPSKHQANNFKEILKQNPAIQYTIEYENGYKSLNFLDINITNTINNKYEFKVHRKKAITNIHIKPTSCIDPHTMKSIFKGFLHRAHSICSEKYIKEEEKLLIDMFAENGHNKQLLKNLVVEYNNKKNNKNNHENKTQNEDYTNLKKLPWIPNISPKIKLAFKKIGKDIAFTSGRNLQQIICQKIKPKLLPNSQPGVYQLDCSCNGKYIGKSKNRVLTRCIKHQQDSMSEKWELSGATEHTKECHGQFVWLHPKKVRILSCMYEGKLREALEINKLRTINENNKTFTVLNRDNGDYITMNSWRPLFLKMGNH